nr:putative reverse transcriptase domain-containing protein [Tanacetum cinerariifolium]
MENCDSVPTPMVEQAKLKLDLVEKPVDHTDYRSMIGSLMYVTSSRPDIIFATCLWYPKDSGFDLTAYSDADHAGCHLDRKSTSGSVQFLGDKLVCWSSKKQNCVSISIAESEYVTISSCCAQVLWMRTQLTDYGFFYDKVPLYCDSKSAIAISCNPIQHTRTKHIDVRYHFIKDHVEKGTMELYFVIIPPRMRTRSAGRPVSESRGGGTSEWVSRGGRGRGPKGGIEKMESVQDMSGCSIDQKVKYTTGSFMGKALTWWNSQICTLSREVVVSMSWNDFKFMMIEEFCPCHEMQKLETELWNHVMIRAGHAAYTNRFHELDSLVPHLVTPKRRKIERYVYGLVPQILGWWQKYGEPSKDKNGRDDNKRTRIGNAFAITSNPVGRENTGKEPSELSFRYEIEIASGQLVEIDKVIKGCKLEIEGHVFDINFIPFGHGSFDVIIGMDWLSNHKAEIICHEKVVRIPLLDGKVLRVLGKRLKEKARLPMSAKTRDKKQEEIVVVRDFPEVFLDYLSGLPPISEIKFRIELIPGAVLIAKSPYHLAPSELEELSRELKELQDKGLAGYYRRFIENFYKIAKFFTILTQKCKTFDWGEEYELAFQTLKDMLCNVPVLALPDGSKDFVVYCNVSGLGLGRVLMLRELFIDYDCEIRYHLGKANVVADALSWKEREAVGESAGLQKGLNEMIKQRSNRTLYYLDRIWVPLKGDVRTLIIDEAHKSKYYVHPGADKMYYDLKDRIAIDFRTKLPRTGSGHDTIWVIVDRLTKSANFLPMREDYKMDRLARLYLNEIVARHVVLISIKSDRDSHFTSRFWQSMQEALGTRLDMSTAYHPQTDGQSERTIQTLEDMLRACVLDFRGSWDVHLSLVEFSYNNSYHSSVRCAPFEALYGRKCRSPIMWAEIGEGQLIGPELIQETTEKISYINDRLKATRMVHFEKKRKLAPRFVGPFEIIEKVGLVAYKLDLPEKLDGVHDTFHVSNLKKCLADPTLQVPLDVIQVDAKLNFVEEPMEILEKEFKKLKRSRIAIVKV